MATPILGSLSVDADLRIEVPVVDLGGNQTARVEIAVSALEPPEASPLWRIVGAVSAPDSVITPPQIRGTTVWVRVSGWTAGGQRTSLYSPAQSIAILEQPEFAAAQVAIAQGIATVTWTPNALTAGVRLRWILHEPADSPGDPTSEAHVQASVGTFTIPELIPFDEAVTVFLEAWNGWNSGDQTVDGELGATVVVSATRIRAARDLSGYFLEAPDGSRWRLVVGNSGELQTEPV